MARLAGVYKITNKKNGVFYIGSSMDIPFRWSRHKSQLRHNKHSNSRLQAAWNLDGEKSFELSIVETFEHAEWADTDFLKYRERLQLAAREQYFIDTLEPEYNIHSYTGYRV